MSLENIIKDIEYLTDEFLKRYNLAVGVHKLKLDLRTKKKVVIDYDTAKLYYHRFNLVDMDGQHVMFSNYLYSIFITELTNAFPNTAQIPNVLNVEIQVLRQDNKTNYIVKILPGDVI